MARAKDPRAALPRPVVVYVWTRAGGRCHLCNEALWKDVLTQHSYAHGKLAHIIAASPDGPRGDPIESPRLVKDPTNLMLLCGKHHDLVDNPAHVAEYSVSYLRAVKRSHEERIERLSAITAERRTVPLIFTAPVGDHVLRISLEEAHLAVSASGRYPDDRERVTIDFSGMLGRDRDDAFWSEASSRLKAELARQLAGARHADAPPHFSVFAFGPIPLLMELGRELGDKVGAEVFNLHREPKGWKWPAGEKASLGFRVREPAPTAAILKREVILKLSVTSQVQQSAVDATLKGGMPVFEVTIDSPRLDCVRTPEDVANFAAAVRDVAERIHRSGAGLIHVFPAVPVALAVEFGRVLLPKLHAPMLIYDYSRESGGFRVAGALGKLNATAAA